MNHPMNYEILKFGISKSAAFVWHAIRDGYNWMAGIQDVVDLKKAQAHVLINELLEKGLIVRVGHGTYKVHENGLGVRETRLEVSDIRLEVQNTRQSGKDSLKKQTLRVKNNSLENQTLSLENQTPSMENQTVGLEYQTIVPVAQESFLLKESKVKQERIENSSKRNLEVEMAKGKRHPSYPMKREWAEKTFKERGISEDLLDRIAIAVNNCPGMEKEKLLELKQEAWEEQKEGKLEYRWHKIANYVKLCYLAANYDYPPCRNAKQIYIDKQRAARKAADIPTTGVTGLPAVTTSQSAPPEEENFRKSLVAAAKAKEKEIRDARIEEERERRNKIKQEKEAAQAAKPDTSFDKIRKQLRKDEERQAKERAKAEEGPVFAWEPRRSRSTAKGKTDQSENLRVRSPAKAG